MNVEYISIISREILIRRDRAYVKAYYTARGNIYHVRYIIRNPITRSGRLLVITQSWLFSSRELLISTDRWRWKTDKSPGNCDGEIRRDVDVLHGKIEN